MNGTNGIFNRAMLGLARRGLLVAFRRNRTSRSFSNELFNVRDIRLVRGGASTAIDFSCMLKSTDLPGMIQSPFAFASEIEQIEERYGSATAFALGALLASGVSDRAMLYNCAKNIDRLAAIIIRRARKPDKITARQRIKLVKHILWQIAPNRSRKTGNTDNFRLKKILFDYLNNPDRPIGDCITLTIIDNLMLMKMGVAVGIVNEAHHVYSTTDGVFTFDNTIADFREAVRRNTGKGHLGNVFNYLGLIAVIFSNQGNHLAHQEKPEESERSFKMAIGLSPNVATFHNNLANLYQEQNRAAEAFKHYNRAIELDGTCPYYYVNRGFMHLKAGELEKAKADFYRAYQLDPANEDFLDVFRLL